MSESSLPRPEPPGHPSLGESEEPPWRGMALFETITPPGEARPESAMPVLAEPTPERAQPAVMPAESGDEPAARPEGPSVAATRGPAVVPSEAPAAHAAPSRRQRRHRAGVITNLLPPADVPEDAEGRVVFYVLSPPLDTPPTTEPLPEAMAEAEPGPLEETLGRAVTVPVHLFLRGGMAGWTPVLLLVVVFVAVFLLGMRLAR